MHQGIYIYIAEIKIIKLSKSGVSVPVKVLQFRYLRKSQTFLVNFLRFTLVFERLPNHNAHFRAKLDPNVLA